MHDEAKTKEQLLVELFELRERVSHLEKERVERKQAEEAVEAERKRLFNVLESLPAMICLLTPDYQIAFANRAFRDRFGESQGRPCYDYCFGRSEPCDFCEAYKVLETGLPHHWEVTAPDGSVIDAYDFPFTDVNGSALILEMDIDITGRKRIEEELRKSQGELELRVRERTSELESAIGRLQREMTERTEAQKSLRDSEERFREIAENIRDVFWVRASDKILYVSSAYEQICGKSCESFYQNPSSFMELVHPDHRDRVRQALLAESGQETALSEEFRIIRPDGTARWLRARSFPVSRQGNIIRRVGIAEDITANKEAEEFLRIERDILFGLGSTGSLAEGMKYLLNSCLQPGGLDSGGIYLVEKETGALRLVCHQGLSDSMMESVTVFEANSPQMRFALKGKVGYWEKPFDEMIMADHVVREGILALLVIPVKYDEGVIAVFCLASHNQPKISQGVQTALEVIAAQIGRIIWRVRLTDTVKSQSKRLKEVNAALKVLLKQKEADRSGLEESLLKNVKHLVMPYLEKLKKSRLADDQKNFVEILESHLLEITSPFANRISSPLLGLTPTEIRVADLIRLGKGSKEISGLLGISEYGINFHRQGIRRKLGLTGKKFNLQTYLSTLQ